MNKFSHSVLFILFLLVFSCDIINPEEQVPAYIEVSEFVLTTEQSSQGTSNSKITEAWVFADEEFLGVYDLPASIPILKSGPTDIRIEAGIKQDGRRVTPDIYPFYKPFEVNLNLEPNKSEVIEPSTTYLPEVQFSFIENFEDNRGRIFTDNLSGDQLIIRNDEDAFEGQYSGQFHLTRDIPIVEFATPVSFSNLMENGVYVYLEINYKSEAHVVWGVVGERDPITGLERYLQPGFQPKAEWNKIYLNMSQMIFSSSLDEYQIALQAFLTPESPDSVNVLIDNIKLVHF